MSETHIETRSNTLTPVDWEHLCHTLMGESQAHYCGSPVRSEKVPHLGFTVNGICEGCGKVSCPTCDDLWRLDGELGAS